MAKMTRANFVKFLAPQATQAWEDGGILFPSIRLAQNILETGGKIHDSFNLGGYKVGSGIINPYWDGAFDILPTWEVYSGKRVEVVAKFRRYKSIWHFYMDQDKTLFQNSRYKRVQEAKTPDEQANALYQCGYATDPKYASKLMAIVKSSKLTQYDTERLSDEDMKTIEYLSGMVEVQSDLIKDLQNRVDPLEEIPSWGVETVEKLVNKGLLKNPELLTAESLQLLVIIDRAELFDKQIAPPKLRG